MLRGVSRVISFGKERLFLQWMVIQIVELCEWGFHAWPVGHKGRKTTSVGSRQHGSMFYVFQVVL